MEKTKRAKVTITKQHPLHHAHIRIPIPAVNATRMQGATRIRYIPHVYTMTLHTRISHVHFHRIPFTIQ